MAERTPVYKKSAPTMTITLLMGNRTMDRTIQGSI